MQDDLAESFPGSGDLELRTTLDLKLQAVVERRLDALLSGPGAAAHASQGAVLVLQASDGAVRAMVGGRDYRQSPSTAPPPRAGNPGRPSSLLSG
ncbi:hypothetical protein ACFQU7_17775 [Pseudoroseomonas wenyumeiae]